MPGWIDLYSNGVRTQLLPDLPALSSTTTTPVLPTSGDSGTRSPDALDSAIPVSGDHLPPPGSWRSKRELEPTSLPTAPEATWFRLCHRVPASIRRRDLAGVGQSGPCEPFLVVCGVVGPVGPAILPSIREPSIHSPEGPKTALQAARCPRETTARTRVAVGRKRPSAFSEALRTPRRRSYGHPAAIDFSCLRSSETQN